jgi:hypothetical protein
MLEDLRADEHDRILKMYRVRWLDDTFSTIGHVYSVMVEELNIKPDLPRFIEKLNEYIKIGGNELFCVKSPLDNFTWKRFLPLQRFLSREFPGIERNSFTKIVRSAWPAFEPPWEE